MTESSDSFISSKGGFIARHMLLLLAVCSVLGLLSAYVYLSNVSEAMVEKSSISNARQYLQALTEFRTLYTSEVVTVAKENGLTVVHNYLELDGAIPLPATLSKALGKRIGSYQMGTQILLYSPYPFPWRVADNSKLFAQDFPNQAWQYLNENPDEAYWVFEEYDERYSIRYAIADSMRPACIDCHNKHPQSPKTDWKVGDVRGVMEVILPVNFAKETIQSLINSTFMVLGCISLFLAGVIGIVFSKMRRGGLSLSLKNTELLQISAEIQTKNQQLERAHQQMEDHARELSSAIKSKSDFLACMSHEIRTPMNGVVGMLQLVLHTSMNDNQRDQLKIAKSSAESLLSLINDILDFTKIDQGMLEIESVDFELGQLFFEFAKTMALRTDAKSIELVLDLTELTQTRVKGDPGRLRQILTNLVGNSIKFTRQGTITLKATLSESTDSDLFLVCQVTDTGLGIPEGKFSDLFDAFTQADASTNREYGGSGLGLSICKRLCELMGGHISVDSTLGTGSCFTFSVKFQVSEQSHLIAPASNISDLSILVVDSNRSCQRVIQTQLEIWGAQVICTDNGKSALNMLSLAQDSSVNPTINFALIDSGLQGMDSGELLKRIRACPTLNEIQLFIMRSLSQSEDENYYIQRGCRFTISKPVSPFDLIRILSFYRNPNVTQHSERSTVVNNTGNDEDADEGDLQAQQDGHERWKVQSRILLVDDIRSNQLVATGLLEGLSLHVHVAENGEDAIHALLASDETEPFNLIFMDCQMPVMDGYEASGRIRKGEAGDRYRRIPIVAMTAHSMVGDREKCIEAGMNDYVSKPINPASVEKALEAWLN